MSDIKIVRKKSEISKIEITDKDWDCFFGKVLHEVCSDRVFCARYGGDEFMIVYSDMTVKEILKVAETIQNNVRKLKGIQVTVTQGIFAHVPQEENREWDFNSMADTVLYHAKKEGRNRYRIVTEFD